MKRYITPIILLIFALYLSACKQEMLEDLTPELSDNCLADGSDFLIPFVDSCRTQPFVRQSGGIPVFPNDPKYLYMAPTSNPNDPNELIYLRKQTDTSGTASFNQLWKFNLCTGEKLHLASGVIGGVSWSVRDWLAVRIFEHGTIFMKSNGDSVLTLSQHCLDFDWSPDGKKVIADIGDGRWGFFDQNGALTHVLDSVHGHATPRWSPDGNHIAFAGYTPEGGFVYIYEVASQHIYQVQTPQAGTYVWADNDHLLTTTGTGDIYTGQGNDDLVRLNIHTGTVNTIKSWCANRKYSPSSISSEGQYLLAGLELLEESLPSSPVLNRYTKLVVMNLNGSNEREIVVE